MRQDESVSWSWKVWVLATTEGTRRWYVGPGLSRRFTDDPREALLHTSAGKAFCDLVEIVEDEPRWDCGVLRQLGDGSLDRGAEVLRSLRVFEVEQRYTLGGLAVRPTPDPPPELGPTLAGSGR